jgi:beta-lactamase class D
MITTIISSLLLFSISLQAQTWDTIKIAGMFGNHKGTMIVYDLEKDIYYRYNPERGRERFLPASTFKIPNSLIGLETGVLKDENHVIKWDRIKREVKEWNQDQTLTTALKYSVVPYYQEFARKVGRQRYEIYLHEMKYGNEKVGDRADTFWLDNSLKISAEEQIIFLKKFYREDYSFSKRAYEIVKRIMSEEKYGESTLKFKTGTGEKEDRIYLGWLVGYVLSSGKVYLYAFNIEAETFNEVAKLRNELPRKILVESNFLE